MDVQILNFKLAFPPIKTLINASIYSVDRLQMKSKNKQAQLHGLGLAAIQKLSGLLQYIWMVLAFFWAFYSYGQNNQGFAPKEVFHSDQLIIYQIAPNSFQHVSFLPTTDFGKVSCNGLLVRDGKEVVIFDTPTNDKSSEMLINWVSKELKCKIVAIVPTHFHEDCLGGLSAFIKQQIPSFANEKTILLAREKNYAIPQFPFNESIEIPFGQKKVFVRYFGEGHTKDNVIGYFSGDEILFGGCLIKELGATKGFLGDANVSEWSKTVHLLKEAYPEIQIVVPGHGKAGSVQLLDYTIELFKLQ